MNENSGYGARLLNAMLTVLTTPIGNSLLQIEGGLLIHYGNANSIMPHKMRLMHSGGTCRHEPQCLPPILAITETKKEFNAMSPEKKRDFFSKIKPELLMYDGRPYTYTIYADDRQDGSTHGGGVAIAIPTFVEERSPLINAELICKFSELQKHQHYARRRPSRSRKHPDSPTNERPYCSNGVVVKIVHGHLRFLLACVYRSNNNQKAPNTFKDCT